MSLLPYTSDSLARNTQRLRVGKENSVMLGFLKEDQRSVESRYFVDSIQLRACQITFRLNSCIFVCFDTGMSSYNGSDFICFLDLQENLSVFGPNVPFFQIGTRFSC